MEYKRTYTLKDVTDLLEWFDTHECEQQVDIGHGQKVFDLDRFVNNSRHMILQEYENPTYSGPIHLLEITKEALINQNKVKGEKSKS